ncbi:hypothetical protein CDAR_417211 [Caerostris darwini]|uniref:Uncharacterized protein n=1 Tax=Caerostris darwini TaxID=1538125 RepID=A0AAV4X588_9ARAC|nr:hypothetical protein CDAR_417211 [Caerostris darwini]
MILIAALSHTRLRDNRRAEEMAASPRSHQLLDVSNKSVAPLRPNRRSLRKLHRVIKMGRNHNNKREWKEKKKSSFHFIACPS